MEEKASIKSAMVSRLPKFGGRSASGSGPSSNGSPQTNSPSQDGKTASPGSRPNGLMRASPFSRKWKRDEGTTISSPTNTSSPGDGGEDKGAQMLPSLTKEVKSASPGTPIMRRSGSMMVAVSSPKAIPKQSSKMSPKVGAQSPLTGSTKMSHGATGISARTGSESRLARPRLGSGSPRSNSQDSLSRSSESLKTLALDNMVRSNSFTHFKQIPSPSNQPMIRSFSFNRAVELAKPLANTQLRPPRSSFLKPPQLSNGRMGLGMVGLNGHGGTGGLGGGIGGTPPAASSHTGSVPSTPSTPTTPSALKKPLLPTCALTKSLGNGFRQTRSGQARQQKPIFPSRVKADVRPLTAPECGGLLGIAVDIEPTEEKGDSPSDRDGSAGDGGMKKGERSSVIGQSSDQASGETLEDMSLSSASSVERGDTSEDFLDDCESLGDVFSDGDQHDNRSTGSSTQRHQHSFLSEAVDWATGHLTRHKDESPMQDSQGPLMISPEQGDACQGSSLELSPSNSSGGTYMWDEEGLEPIGGPGTHGCVTYDDSDLQSMDILNNLDPPGSGELGDDDLMLDVDLPEDGVYDTDKMSQIERSERARWQGQHRKHRHFHSDSRARFHQHYDSLKSPKGPVGSEAKQHGFTPVLDELTMEHMTEDCSSLKTQLLRLKSLLQLEDTNSPADVAEEIEDNSSTASQVEELIKEVQELREELRSRDKTIVQLTLQCQQLQHQREQMSAQGRQGRCQCHHQRAPSSSLRHTDRQMDRRMQQRHDKATQTYWRSPSHPPQILQPSNPCLTEHFLQGRLVKTLPTEGHNDLARKCPEKGAHGDADCPLADASTPDDPSELSRLLSTHLQCPSTGTPPRVTARDRPPFAGRSAARQEWRAQDVVLQDSAIPRPAGPACPRMLQPPRSHRGVSLPALRSGCLFGPLADRPKQLPPPSRGLPCFDAGPQMQVPSACRTSLLQPHRTSQPLREPMSTSYDLQEPSQRGLRHPASAKRLIPLRRSCLPKPRIP